MNEDEQGSFESYLRNIKPARVPAHLMARLQDVRPGSQAARQAPVKAMPISQFWSGVLRWMAPAMALVILALVLWQVSDHSETDAERKPLAATYGLKADDVLVDQELVSSFEVVATLPGGEPVRFRCQKWKDRLTVTDTNRGFKIERSRPRIEVVPVRFETY